MGIAIKLVAAAIAIVVTASPIFAQAPILQQVELEARSASRALDAVPAVFAVARNLDGIEIDVSVDSMASGFADLAGQESAQSQLVGALGAYGFETYDDWAATVRTLFAVYEFLGSAGPSTALIEEAVSQVLKDPSVPQSQKDAIQERMSEPIVGNSQISETVPTRDNLAIVVALLPQIESTIEMMQAMQ
jgi:hypothetical protein